MQSRKCFSSKALMDTNAPIEFAIFEGITHLGFTDMKFYVRSKMMMGKMPAQEMSDRLIGLHCIVRSGFHK